jgi:uncharacterized protein (TIGR03083 family)
MADPTEDSIPGPTPNPTPGPTPDDIATPDPIDVWRAAMVDLRDAATRAPWRNPSVLPGWTVADVVAHVTWIERSLLDRQDPAHEPDWDALPHAKEGFGRITEVPVDLRRSRTREEVLAEFDETMADREVALRAQRASDPGLVMSPLGTMMPLDEMIAMRVFDTWVHEQDIRVAVGDPGHLGTAPAHMAAGRMRRALGFVWAKKVDAPIGATLQVTVTGPGVEFSDTVIRTEDGKGRPNGPVADPTVGLTMSFPGFVAVTCGRGPAEVELVGDQELGQRTIDRFNIAP